MNQVYFLAGKEEPGMNSCRCYKALDLIAESKMLLHGRVRPMHLRVGNVDMDCVVDLDQTVFPGAEYAIHFSDGSEPARVIYDGWGRNRIVWRQLELEVRYRNLGWKFFVKGKHLASMIPVEPTDPIGAVLNSRWVPRYTMMSREKLPEILAALMLHFPLLQIGI